MRKLTTKIFVQKSEKIHFDKYDYSNTSYCGCEIPVSIKCNKCSLAFDQKPSSHLYGCGCPYCAGRKVSSKNSFGVLFPHLAQEWCLSNKISAFDVTSKSERKIWWLCPKGHRYQMRVCHRSSGSGCPYCSGRRALFDNCLANQKPESAKRWHYKKNNGLTPYNVTPSSGKKVWWICKNGHEYQSVIYMAGKAGCPYCSGRLPTKENSLGALFPKIANNWSAKNKLNPFEVTPKSRKKVWWFCPECESEYQARIDHRTISGSECPKCLYKNQREVELLLCSTFPNLIIVTQKILENYPEGRIRKCDFWFKNGNVQVIVEYDGIQHFKPITVFGGEKRFKEQQKIDQLDKKFCEQNNVILFRIAYYEDKQKRIRNLKLILNKRVEQ